MNPTLTRWLAGIFVAIGFVFMGALLVSVWTECRDEGHSFAYCMMLTSR